MKKKILLIGLVFEVTIFLIFSFLAGTFNAQTWAPDGRITFGIISVIGVIAFCIMYLIEIYDHRT